MQKTTVQSLIFDKKNYTVSQAKKWLKDNGYKYSDVDEKEQSIRFRQSDPSNFKDKSFRTISFKKGIQAVIGKPKSSDEAMSSGSASALLRDGVKKESKPITGRLIEAVAEGKESKYKAVMISEGLGNRANMNYYGPEAIKSAPALFEGKPCFIDHSTATEEEDRPERSVWHKCGYWKNCKTETIDGLLSCTGEIHLDKSESGEFAKNKLDFALHYKKEFPTGKDEYIGFSIVANGDTDRREMDIEGERLSVNFVTRFTEAESCDMVTAAGRGGKVLALLESMAGRKKHNTEETMKEAIKKILSALSDEVAKSKLSESNKVSADKITAMLKEAEEKCEAEGDETEEEESEGSDEMAKLKKENEALLKDKENIAAKIKALHDELHGKGGDSDEEEPSEAEEAKKKEDEAEAEESNKLAKEYMLKEAGEAVCKVLDSKSLKSLSLKECKAKIAETKKLIEAVRTVVPAGSPEKISASDSGEYKEKL